MERMTQQDYDILSLEDDVVAAHGMTIAVFDGPEPAFDDVIERIADRVRLVPRYRQRLVNVPLDLERPVWVDDPTFSICLLYTSPSPRDLSTSRMPSSA